MVRCLLSVLLGLVLHVLSFPTPLRAQVQGSNGWYEYECQRESDESYGLWISRCNNSHGPESAERAREAARQRAEYEKLKATLLKQAPLPASRNRVIGRWQQAPRPRVPKDVISQITNIFTDGCELLFGGDGTVEFRADRWLVTDVTGTDDLGPVAYREGQKNTVFVLPQIGAELLVLQLETPDRFRVTNSPAPCVMLRSTAAAAPPARGAAAAPGRATAPAPAGRNAAPAPAGRTNSAPPPAATTTASRLFTLNDLMGYQCANGEQLVVNSCSNTSDESNCGVIRMDLPLRNGFQVRTNVTRGVLVKQVSACKVQKVMLDQDGNVVPAK